MVNVHGGGFCSFSGSPETSSPDHFMDRDIILVTFNYRLHVLGNVIGDIITFSR